MNQCENCDRVHRDESCPFCDRSAGGSRVLHTVGGALTSLVLAACYGAPNTDLRPPTDTGPDDTGLFETGDTGDTGDTATTDDTGSAGGG